MWSQLRLSPGVFPGVAVVCVFQCRSKRGLCFSLSFAISTAPTRGQAFHLRVDTYMARAWSPPEWLQLTDSQNKVDNFIYHTETNCFRALKDRESRLESRSTSGQGMPHSTAPVCPPRCITT